jgi:very-short-patch-repair endonuclease
VAETRKNEVPARLRSFAKEQRAMLTRAEDLFWEQVRGGRLSGFKFRRQVPIAPYIVDFLCASARVVVELDGPPHDSSERQSKDAKRDMFLRQQGFRVLRFSNDEFFGNPQLVMDLVLQAIQTALYPPASTGEGATQRVAGEDAAPPLGSASATPSPGSLRSPPSPAEGRG